MNPEAMGNLFDQSQYGSPYVQEPPPFWTAPVPRFSVEGGGRPSYGLGYNVPVGQDSSVGFDARVGPHGERRYMGTYRRGF